MPRLTRDQWYSIRAEREAGASFRDLAARHNVTIGAIHKRSKLEEWGDGKDAAETIRKKVKEKVNGFVNNGDPKKNAAAIDAAADRGAEVIRRHQEEPNSARERVYAGLKAHRQAVTKEQKQLAFEDLKAAKIASEALAIIHKMERQAWNLDAPEAAPVVMIERSYGK